MRLAVAAAICCCAAAASTATAANIRKGDGSWARAIVLREADLPSFAGEPASGGRTCLPAHLDGQTAFARSKQFSQGPRNVAARAWIFPEEGRAKKGFRALIARDYAECLAREGVVGARILSTSQQRFGGATAGDNFRGIRVTARLVQAGQRFTVYVDIVFVRRGRALADAAFTSTLTPFGYAAETATVGRMSTRMARPPGRG